MTLIRNMTYLTQTSVLAKKCLIADGARLCKSVELVQPFSGNVELQQAGLLHVGQSHHLLPLSDRLLAAFPVGIVKKHLNPSVAG